MTFEQWRRSVAADQFRYEAGRGWRDFCRQWFKESGFRFTTVMRTCAFLRAQSWSRYGLYHLCLIWHRRQQVRLGVYIDFSTQIGPGLCLDHAQGIVINRRSVIGADCTLSHQVTLGKTHERSRHPGCPAIGDRVYLGCGAKILGGVTLGNDSAVAPNAVVAADVPAMAVVGGIPARVLSMNGSAGYVARPAGQL